MSSVQRVFALQPLLIEVGQQLLQNSCESTHHAASQYNSEVHFIDCRTQTAACALHSTCRATRDAMEQVVCSLPLTRLMDCILPRNNAYSIPVVLVDIKHDGQQACFSAAISVNSRVTTKLTAAFHVMRLIQMAVSSGIERKHVHLPGDTPLLRVYNPESELKPCQEDGVEEIRFQMQLMAPTFECTGLRHLSAS